MTQSLSGGTVTGSAFNLDSFTSEMIGVCLFYVNPVAGDATQLSGGRGIYEGMAPPTV